MDIWNTNLEYQADFTAKLTGLTGSGRHQKPCTLKLQKASPALTSKVRWIFLTLLIIWLLFNLEFLKDCPVVFFNGVPWPAGGDMCCVYWTEHPHTIIYSHLSPLLLSSLIPSFLLEIKACGERRIPPS